MNIEEIREYCLNKADASEGLPFGLDVLVFKAFGKMFLLLPLNTEDVRFNVKCDPELAIELRAQYPCVLPGYHMNKKLWNTIVVDGSIPDVILRECDLSHELIRLSTLKKKGKKRRMSQKP